VLAAYALTMLGWSMLRLPESLHPHYRRSLAWRDIVAAARTTVSETQSRGYTIALTLVSGCLVAYIASVQQIVAGSFGKPSAIGFVFAAIAAPMALASWGNSKLVGRFGLRRVGHSGMAGLAVVAVAHSLVGWSGSESLGVFVAFQGLAFVCFAFSSANLSTLAMEHMASIAGTASSVQGVVATVGGAIIGFAIGRAFDGTAQPFLWGMAACATGAFAIILMTEPNRLFATVTRTIPPEAAEPPPEI
jgi:DHA1 family bicyclomycin/chloramphenicol resistance-like MFS transporter